MSKRFALWVLAACTAFSQSHNTLTPAERSRGWTLLFDDVSLDGWMWSLDEHPQEPSWAVDNGELRTAPERGSHVYLLTRESFADFELAFEWKAGTGANSGVKYRVQGYWIGGPGSVLGLKPEPPGRIEPIALEYQITDDEGHPDALAGPAHSSAALYLYAAPQKDGPAKANVWHSGRIVVRGLHVEHWLDGRKVVNVELDSPELQAAFAQSPRGRSSPLLAKQERRTSPIALQFHDGVVCFRDLKIRRL